MENSLSPSRLTCWSVLLLIVSARGALSGEVSNLAWDNFTLVQEGEWMIEFFAPWCPACQQFTSTWESFADQMSGESVKVVKVDVTVETMLSGRFMVTHLPSIYHIYNGEVRQYPGERTLSDLSSYIEDQKWKDDDTIPSWRSPTASHMYLIGTIFWFSEKAKEVQVVLEKDYELPTYAIFILIAIATIVIGLLLGGLTVCVIEICLRCCSRRSPATQPREPRPKSQDKKTTVEGDSPAPKEGLEEVTKSEEKKEGKEETKEGVRKRAVKGK